MKKTLFMLGLMLVSLTACKLSQFNPFRQVIEHPQPEFIQANTFFTDLGCTESPECLPESFLNNTLPIDTLSEPPALFGGLSPYYPMAVAGTMVFGPREEFAAVFSEGCMATQYVRYVVNVDGELKLINSSSALADLYAPIESEGEALSYALAVTGLSALYDLDQDSKIKHLVKPLEETYARFDGERFTVHLFDTYICGCGPHIIYSVEVIVEQDGTFKLGEPVEAFSDPALDGMCID